MPVGFLSDEQARRFGRFGADLTPDQLARHFHLDDVDHAFVAEHRGDHNRLGIAVQLGAVRHTGTFVDEIAIPHAALRYVADQLALPDPAAAMAAYAVGEVRWRHRARIRSRYGYREFTEPVVAFRLTRFLYALCWTGTNRPSALFDRATAWLVTAKVLLPGATMLERTVARIRARAGDHFHRRLVRSLTIEQRAALDTLVTVPQGGRQSPLDRLRDGPTLQSGPEIVRAVRRLVDVRTLCEGLPDVDWLPPGKVQALARFAMAAKAQAIGRLPEDRRAATLLAFVRTLEAAAGDDVLDLFDAVATTLFGDAEAAVRQARLRTLRDLDAASLKLRDATMIILDENTADADLRKAIFGLVARAELTRAAEQVTLLAEPMDSMVPALLRKAPGKLCFTPALLRGLDLDAAPAGRRLLEAVRYLAAAQDGAKPPGPPPTTFASKVWTSQLKTPDGRIDIPGYRLAVLDGLRRAIRRRDVFPVRSLRYVDPRRSLLAGAAWDAARPAVCRTLGVSASADEELGRLSQRLDRAWQETAARIAHNPAVTVVPASSGTPTLAIEALDKLEEPPSLVALRTAVETRLPRLDLPELLLEVHARTGFADRFTHASESGARAEDIVTSLCAVLVAEATNTGFEPLTRLDTPALRRSRLSWVKQNYLRAETLTAANAALVAAQNAIGLARAWGGGEVASADGLRFVVPVKTIHAGPNPRYFGRERGVTWYNLVSDQFTGLNAVTVPGTMRDSLNLLALVLEQDTDLAPSEIMTDTAGYTDAIFGIFHLLGFQFSPRIADAGESRLWRVDRHAHYGALDALAAHRVDLGLVAQHWDDLLRLAGSLKLGTVGAAGLTRMLQTNDRPSRLALALRELGRIVKTLYLLRYIDDADYRRHILTQLNRHEGRHRVARAIFHGRRGELRQRYREGQEDQLGALGLVTNMVVLWNTIYMDAALAQLARDGHDIRPEDVARLSPLVQTHVNMLGRYAFTLPDNVAAGELRPLRDPRTATLDDP